LREYVETRERPETEIRGDGVPRQLNLVEKVRNSQGTATPREYAGCDLVQSPSTWHKSRQQRPDRPPERLSRVAGGGAVKGTISFHRDNSVGDYEMNRHRCTNIQNALLDTSPMKNVLRPTVLAPRDNPEHVLHAQSDTGPVVHLYLWHGDNEVRLQDCSGKPEVLQVGVRSGKPRPDEFVAVEIHERNFVQLQLLLIGALGKHELSVALVSRALANNHVPCTSTSLPAPMRVVSPADLQPKAVGNNPTFDLSGFSVPKVR